MDTTALIFQKLGRLYFEGWTVNDARITYQEFARVLFNPEMAPQYSCMRTIREKWNTVQMLGFAKLCNNTTIKFDIEAVRRYLEAVA